MNDKQIENWRRVLSGMIGPYALIMPKEQIIAMRDRLQSKIDTLSIDNAYDVEEKQDEKFCACDPSKHATTRHLDDSITCNKCQKTRK